MNIYQYINYKPEIAESAYIAPSSVIIGRATLNKHANIWFQTVIRADVNKILIGENANIQDLSMLHVTEKFPLVIGKNVTVGHSAILHGCEIGDGTLIGMGAKVLDGAVIGRNCLVASGSVVPPGKVYPDNSFIIGTPAKAIRELTSEEIVNYSNHYKSYVELAESYKEKKHFFKLS